MDSTTPQEEFFCRLGDEDIERELEELYEVCRKECRKECRDGECQLAVANGGTCPLELIR